MSGRPVKAGQAYVEIGIRNRIAKGAKAVQADLNKMSKSVASTGAKTIALATAGLAPLAAAAFSFGAAGDELDKMSQRTGIAVEALSSLAFAAEQSGSDLATVERGVKGMQRALFDAATGGETLTDSLAMLGVNADHLTGMLPEDQFTLLADRIGGIEDPSTKAALSMKLFGRAGADLLPLFNSTGKGIAALRAEASELGRTMSTEDAKSAAEFTDAMNRMKSVMTGIKNQIGAAVAPVFTDLANTVARSAIGIGKFIGENRKIILVAAGAAAAVGGVGVALVSLGGALSVASLAVGGIAAGFAFLVSPIGIAIAATGALGFALVKYTSLGSDALKWLQDRFGALVETVRGSIGAITSAIQAGDMQLAWELTTQLMELVWLDLTSGMRDTWDDAMGWILDAGSETAMQVGKIFQTLAGTFDAMLDAYASYYDKASDIFGDAFNSAADSITGVETIGAKSAPKGSAFEQQFGGVEDSLRSTIDGIRSFGKAMEDEARGQKGSQAQGTADAKQQRQERIRELRASLNSAADKSAVENAAGVGAGVDEMEKGFGDLLASLIESPEDLAMKMPTMEDQKPGRVGATGSFSAIGAMISGQGQSFEQKSLNLAERTAKATEQAAAELAKKVELENGEAEGKALKMTATLNALQAENKIDGPGGRQDIFPAAIGMGPDLIEKVLVAIEKNTGQAANHLKKNQVARFA